MTTLLNRLNSLLPQSLQSFRGALRGSHLRTASTFGSAPGSSPPAALALNQGRNYPTPVNLSYFRNFGSPSALCLGLRPLSGIFPTLHDPTALYLVFCFVGRTLRPSLTGKGFPGRSCFRGTGAFFSMVGRLLDGRGRSYFSLFLPSDTFLGLVGLLGGLPLLFFCAAEGPSSAFGGNLPPLELTPALLGPLWLRSSRASPASRGFKAFGGLLGGLLLLPPLLLLGPRAWLEPLLEPLLQQFGHLQPRLPQLQLLLEGLLPLLLPMALPALLLLALELWHRLGRLWGELVRWYSRRLTLCDRLWERSLEARQARALRRSDPHYCAPGLAGLRWRLGHQPLEWALVASLPGLLLFYGLPLLLLDLAAAKQGMVTATRLLLLGSEFGGY